MFAVHHKEREKKKAAKEWKGILRNKMPSFLLRTRQWEYFSRRQIALEREKWEEEVRKTPTECELSWEPRIPFSLVLTPSSLCSQQLFFFRLFMIASHDWNLNMRFVVHPSSPLLRSAQLSSSYLCDKTLKNCFHLTLVGGEEGGGHVESTSVRKFSWKIYFLCNIHPILSEFVKMLKSRKEGWMWHATWFWFSV